MTQAKKAEHTYPFKLTDQHGGMGVICEVKPDPTPIPNFKLTNIPGVSIKRT